MPDRILLPLIVACALFMQNLDSTVLSTALPAIADDFAVSPIQLKLALTSYLLSLAVFIPASGWLADRFGSRTIFQVAIFTFTVGSVFCGLSNSIGEMIAARVVQGIGGAMMVPVGRLVILRSVSKSELVGALAWLTVPALFGPICGPPLGGFITTYASWRWIFWINVPIGMLGLFLATLFIPNIFGEKRAFDFRGFLLSGVGLAAFITGSTSFGLDLLPPTVVWTLLVGGGALLVLYVLHSRRVAFPILDLSLFGTPTFLHSIVGASLFRIGAGATPFLLPLLLQVGFGMSPFESGLITFASALGALFMKAFAPPLLWRFGFRRVLLINCVLAAVFIAVPAGFTATTPIAMMLALILAGGFFRSLQFTSISALTFADVPHNMMSGATTISGVAQQLSLSLGVSAGAMAVEATLHVTGQPLGAEAFGPAFIVVGLIALASIVPLMYLAPDAGDELSGRRPAAEDPTAAARTGSSG
jgi:EmrB/QacA subfamily drug resistance transporter